MINKKDTNEEYFQNWYKNFKIKCENDSVERLMNKINKYTIKNIKLKKEIKELKETNVQLFMEYIKENERATKLEEQISLLKNKIHNLKQINEFHKKTNGELQQENKQLKERIEKAIEILLNEISKCKSAITNPEYTICGKHELLKQEINELIKSIRILKGE